jgi:hypothetical protein
MDDKTPFADLPAALVAEMLDLAPAVGDELIEVLSTVKSSRVELRSTLMAEGLLLNENSLPPCDIPTSCAADGSYGIERLLTTDLGVAAAVVVEGLTPPSETRFWEEPRHKVDIFAETHDEDTSTVLRALMLGEELTLAASAPHELVMVDGTLTLPAIYFNQALSAAPRKDLECGRKFLKGVPDYLSAFQTILSSPRSDKNFVGCPKYSTLREIGNRMGWPESHDDRGLLSLVLEAGQMTEPLVLQTPTSPWHIALEGFTGELRDRLETIAANCVRLLGDIHVFYYRPRDWLPAFRVEIGGAIASNRHRLASVVQGIKAQTVTGSMLEPYPLYLADRIVKAAAKSLPAFRQVATQRIAETYEGNLGEVFFAMHGYRSEQGR